MSVLDAVQGVSFDPCSNNFCGAGPASEPETQVAQDEIARLGSRIKVWPSTPWPDYSSVDCGQSQSNPRDLVICYRMHM